MKEVKHSFIVFYFMLSGFVVFGQTPGGETSDEMDDNFYEALTQKAIENYDKAIVLLQKNIQKDPKNAVFYNQLGKNYFALKNYGEAEVAYRKAIELDGMQKWYWIDLYNLFYTTKDYKKAIPIAIRICDFDIEYQDDLVSLYVYAKEYEKALVLLNELEKRGKLSLAMERFKFQVLSELSYTNKLKQDFNQAVASHSTNEGQYTTLIVNYIHDNQFEKAYKTIDEMVVNIPKSDWAYVNKYRSALKNNQYENAYQYLTSIVNSGIIAELMKHRAFNEYLLYVDKNEKYLPDLESFVDYFNNQDLINVAKEVGIFFYNKDKLDIAQLYLSKGIKTNQNDVDLISLYIQSYLDINNIVKAEELATYYLNRFPAEPKFYFYLGLCQNKLNEPKKALKNLNEALAYLIDDTLLEANIYKQIAICYDKLGNVKQKENYILKANQLLKNYDQ
jgi:tetratricopeptide (TPR) repeat protein